MKTKILSFVAVMGLSLSAFTFQACDDKEDVKEDDNSTSKELKVLECNKSACISEETDQSEVEETDEM